LLDDSEHLLHNHRVSVASLRLLFTFAPECRSASHRDWRSPSPEYPLPPTATFREQRLENYQESGGGNPRWALPDMIATSKLDRYAWQDEYRLIFSFTDALSFEKVNTRLVRGKVQETPHAR
jgi:hypothetical protein